MATRVSLIFQFATAPPAGSQARIHTAGWTESYWSWNPVSSGDPSIRSWASVRQNLLPPTASIVGFRISDYTIVQNKFVPTGTASGKLNYPGGAAGLCDIPQMGLEIGLSTLQGPNTARVVLRGIPDNQVTGGEYSPDGIFKGNVTRYCTEIENKGWRFAGRDLSIAPLPILSVAGNVVTLAGNIGAVKNLSSVRFLNAKADGGKGIVGAYLVTDVAGNTITLAGYSGGNMSTANGKMRIDIVTIFDIVSAKPSRVVVRKVGRPFEGYRGRQSKRRKM